MKILVRTLEAHSHIKRSCSISKQGANGMAENLHHDYSLEYKQFKRNSHIKNVAED